jgi:uncharacterized protein with NRDE domain
MCLIAIAYRAHPRYELLLAANRDEFHRRPTAAAAPWEDAPEVVGGRDLVGGGAWLALSARRRLAAVTNVRRMEAPDPSAPSRGQLVADFVRADLSAEETAGQLMPLAERYAGFNLLLWDGEALVYLSNRPAPSWQRLRPGVHAVSNAQLDTPWPKLQRLRKALGDQLSAGPDPETLLAALADERPPPDAELPDTGVGLDVERRLAPPFIRGADYGTRASSLLWVPSDGGDMHFIERRFGPNGVPGGESRLSLAPRP